MVKGYEFHIQRSLNIETQSLNFKYIHNYNMGPRPQSEVQTTHTTSK